MRIEVCTHHRDSPPRVSGCLAGSMQRGEFWCTKIRAQSPTKHAANIKRNHTPGISRVFVGYAMISKGQGYYEHQSKEKLTYAK